MIAAGLHKPVSAADFASMSLHKTMCGPRAGILLTQAHLRDGLDKAVFPGIQGALFPQLMAAKAVCLSAARSESFGELQVRILENARAMAETFLAENVALLTGGTESHLLMVQVEAAGTAPAIVAKLARAGILTNANYTVGDEIKTGMSGIRIGTTWISQLGFYPDHARRLAGLLVEAMHPAGNEATLRTRLVSLVEEVLC